LLGAIKTVAGEAICGEMGKKRKQKRNVYRQRFWELGKIETRFRKS